MDDPLVGHPRNHHFIPRFMLRQWESGVDKRITTFAWKHGQLREDRCKARSVAVHKDVYSFRRYSLAGCPEMETLYFSRLDNEASKVHHALLKGQTGFSPKDITLWSHFILALENRTPWAIEQLARDTPGMLAEMRRIADAAGLSWSEDEFDDGGQDYLRDLTLESMPKALGKGKAVELLADAAWQVLRIDRSPFDLLIGDQAVLRQGALDSTFMIFVPISPVRAICVADATSARRVRTLTDREVAMRMNKVTVERAREYVFATDGSQRRLVEKTLRIPR